MASFVGDKDKKKVVSKGGVGSKPAPKPSPKPTSKPPSTQPAKRTQPAPAPKTKPVLTPAERRRDYPGAQGYPPRQQEPEMPNWEALRSWAPPPAREEIENKLATWKPRIGPVQRDEQVTNTFLPVFQTRPADRPAPRPSTLTRPEVNRDVPPIGVSAPIGGRTETLRSPSPVSSSDRLRGPYFSTEQINDKLSEERRRLRAEASVGRVAAMGLAVPKPPPSAGPFTTAVAQANAPNLGVLSLDDIGEFRFPGGQAAAVEQRAETKFERIGRSQEENARLAQERLEAAFPQVTSPLTGDSMTIGVNPLQSGASLWSRLRATPATEKLGEAVATTGAVVGTMADAFFSMAGSAPFIDPMLPGVAGPNVTQLGSPANVIGEVLEAAEDTAAKNAQYQWMPKWLQKGMAWMGLLNPSNFGENLGIALRAMPEIEANALAMAAQTGDEVIARNALYSGTMAEAEDLIAKHETTLAELPRQIMVAQQQAAFAAGNGDFPSAEQWRLEAAKLGAQYATMKEMKTVDVVQPAIDPLKDMFFNVVLDLTNVLDIPGGIIAEGFRVGAAMEVAGAVDEAGAALNVAEATARANLVNQNALDAARAAGLVQIDQAQEAAVDVMRAANPGAFVDEAAAAVDDRLPLPPATEAARQEFRAGERATWRVADSDQPVVITALAGEADGIRYWNIEGTRTAVPETQLIKSVDEVAAASTPAPTVAATTPAPRGPSNPAALMPPGKAVDIRKMPGVPLAKDEAASRGWRKLFGLTTESLAVQRRDTVMQALASVVSPIKGITINDARHLITTLIDEPMALVRGVPATAFETEAIRAMAGPDGLIKFGPGLVAPSNMKEYWPYLTAARDQILGLPTLTGRGPLNKMAFVGELDDVIYDTARQLLGRPRSFSEVPPFTRRWDVRKVPGTGDGTGTPSMSEVIFYDQKHGGVELGRTAPMPTGDAKRYKGALAAAVNAQGASSRLAETLALPMKFQRAIMTDMFLGFRPANWVKNAGAAYGTMLADDLLTFVPMTDALAALEAKLGPTFGSNRIVDASKGVAGGAMPGDLSHHWSDRFRDGPLGGVARAYGKLAKRALNIPYGATSLKIGNIELPIGEQNFYTRIFQKAFERAFNKEWPIVVARAFTTPLLKAGVPPEIAKQLTDLMIQVGRTGSKDDVIRAMRKAISDNFVAPTLAKLGVNPDLLPSGLQARITNILTNPSRLSLEEVIQQIDEAFAPHLERASGLADAASVSPAPQEFTTASRVDDLDDAEQQMREALVNAGMPPGVAQDVAAEHAAGVKVAEQKAVAALLSEVVSLPSSLHSADITLAYWMRYSEMTQRWRQATDAINQAAFAEIGRLKKAGGAGAETTNVWMKTANDLANLHKKFLDDLKKLTDDIRLEQAADAPPVRGAVNDEQMTAFRAQMNAWEQFDAEANAAMRGKEIQLGEVGEKEYREVIDAGRNYVDTFMMEAFAKWQATPTMDGLDHLAQAMKLSHEAGHKTAIETQRLWREARAGRIPWEEARLQSNALWRDMFEQEAHIWQAAGNVAGSAVPFSATADAPVFIPISPRTRNRLMDVGSEFYRKNWGDARDRLVSHMTGGRETSANALSEDQAKRLIDGIEQLIRERDAVRPVQSVTRDMLLARMKQVPNWTEEQAEAVIKLLDQRAKVWSRITGETEEAWYQAYIADIKASRGVTGKDVRFQAGDVTTPEFKAWFKNSVVVDENGAPLRVFHGTSRSGFDEFSLDFVGSSTDSGWLGEGFYFTSRPDIADVYSGNWTKGAGVYPVYLSIQNPLRVQKGGGLSYELTQGNLSEFSFAREILQRMGVPADMTGMDALSMLRERYGTSLESELAVIFRQTLVGRGVDGVVARTAGGGFEYVVFDDRNIKSVFNAGEWGKGNLLHQGAKGAMQPLEDGRAVIHAFRNADFSTIIHETWHVFERDMADIAKRFPDTDMAKDYAELRKWAKAQYDRLQPKRKWANENIGISEVIAEAGELYAREGRAPTGALKNVFEKFKEWMLAIYKSLRADWPKMDNDVRGIFDRMLTVNDDIARATDEVAPLAPAPPAPPAPAAPVAAAAPVTTPPRNPIIKQWEETFDFDQRLDMVDAAIRTLPVEIQERARRLFDRMGEKDGKIRSIGIRAGGMGPTPKQQQFLTNLEREYESLADELGHLLDHAQNQQGVSPSVPAVPLSEARQTFDQWLKTRAVSPAEVGTGNEAADIAALQAKYEGKKIPANIQRRLDSLQTQIDKRAELMKQYQAETGAVPAAAPVQAVEAPSARPATPSLKGNTVEAVTDKGKTITVAAKPRDLPPGEKGMRILFKWFDSLPVGTRVRSTHASNKGVLGTVARRQVAQKYGGSYPETLIKWDNESRASLTHPSSVALLKPDIAIEITAVPPLQGRATTGWTDPARKYEMQYEVVELDDLVASNSVDGVVNPSYPAQFQPRDRTQAASQQQVQSMAQKLSPDELLMETNAIDRGAPVINADRVVLAGNGHTMATRLAPPERYDAYKAALTTQASQFGIDPAQLATMKKPVLVRRLQNADELAFSAEANQSAVLAMNELEKAKQLAKQVTDQDLRNLEMGASRTVAGALNQQRNMPFVQRFMSYVPANERAALMDAKGGITPALAESVRATLFAMVFKDNVVLANYVMSGAVDLKNLGNGIESVIQKLALLQKTNPALAIGDDIGEAATILMRLRSEGTSLDTFLAQIGMFDKPPREEVTIILRAFNENMRSGKAIGDFLNEYADAALRYATGQTSDLIEVPTKLDLLNNVSGGTSRFQEALFQPARNRRYRPPMRGPDWANADTIHRAWDADARFISNTRNQADPSIGRISQDDMRHMAEARDTIHRTLPEAWNNPTPNTLTREQRIVALDSLQKAMQGWDNTIAASQWLGSQAADFAMLNYSRRRNFDTILAMLMPYHYFWSRSATNWGQRVLRKPSIGNLYWEMEHHMQQAERQRDLQNSGLPARVDDRVRAPIWGDWFMGNPLNLLLPFNSYLMNSYVDPETANNAYEKAWLQARGVMPVGAPGYNFIIDAMLDAIFPREGDLSRKDEYGIGDIAPLVAQGTAWQQAIWGTHAPTWASGDPYRIGLSARQVGTDSTIPLEMRKWAMDVGYQLLHNVGALPEQPAEAERVWTDAAKAAGFDKAMALSLAFVLGLPFARVRVQEQEANQALSTYRTLGYSERNPAGSASAKRTFAEETNYLPFSKAAAAGLYPSRTESVGDPEGAFDRPGYSALRDQKKQEKEALDAEYEQRINDFWKANEWSDPKVQKQGIEEIDAWHREAKAALEQKYADMPEGEFPTAYQSYSPEEVQAAALENAARQASEYAQEAVTLPPYPGDDASDEVWDAYGAAKDKQTQAEIDSLTRLLMNKVALSKLVNGRSVTPYSETEARKLAEEMVADISWMPEGKQEWVAQKEQRQAEWEAQEAEAMRLFGNNILDIAEEYDSNWPAAKKEAFLDKYPKLIEYWEWRDANWTDDSEDTEFQREWEQNVATERERRNDAMEMFGDDIFDIRDGYDSDWPQWKKDEYKAKYPQLQKFWDWWYDDEEAGTDGGFKDKLVRGGVGKNKRTGARKGVGGQTTKSRSSRPRREPYVKGARPFRARRFRPGYGGAGSLAPAGGVGDFSNTDWGFPQGSYLGNNWDEGMQGPQLYRPGDMMRIPMSSLRSWK